MKIVISAGHGLLVRGAAGPPPWGLDEVDEARRVMYRTAELLRAAGVETVTYADDISTSQSENLDRIVNFHNAQGEHDYDVSVHFNAYEVTTTKKMGVECLYVTQEELADEIAAAMADAADLPNRGPKYRSDLAFLNGTREKAVLVETLFCDAKPDCDSFRQRFEAICSALASTLAGEPIVPPVEPPGETPPGSGLPPLFRATGRCSWFGGPDDTGVAPDEGLAFFDAEEDAPHLFLPEQPPGTTGLARRLNPGLPYVACRWPYDRIPKSTLARPDLQALVRARGREFLAWPADWGPAETTGRIADLSPALLHDALGLETDDEVEVIYPAPTTPQVG